MIKYKKLVHKVLSHGEVIMGRNGDTLQTVGETIRHNMKDGFPCLTIRSLNYQHAITELRFFLLGKTNVKWLNDRGNHFWDKFAFPDGEIGPAYGPEWINFNDHNDNPYGDGSLACSQLTRVIQELKSNPTSRRLLVSAWNPLRVDSTCLPPCHDSFQFLSNGKDLDLIWRQRSCDIAVGLPWDMMLYAFLLMIVSKECGLIPRKLVGHFGSTHIYRKHENMLTELCTREPCPLPHLWMPMKMTFEQFRDSDVFAYGCELRGYNPHPKMNFEVVR